MLHIKKTLCHPKADPEKRSIFCKKIKDYKEQGRAIAYVDESGFAHDMPRTHGYSLKGTRCFGTKDWGAKGRTNVIGALMGEVLLTVALFQTSINTVTFDAWIIEDLAPKLSKNRVVVMDNATFHKSAKMIKELEAKGHEVMYLPPYSPDLNPIEKKWAQAKARRSKYLCSIDELFQATDL